MDNIMTGEHGTAFEFPTPQELAKARRRLLEPDVRAAKAKLRAALMEGKKSVGWDFPAAVFEEVKLELALKGWKLTYNPGGQQVAATVTIEIAGKGQR